MSFNFKKVSEKPVKGAFERDGEVLNITVNANALTGKRIGELNDEAAAKITVITGMQQQTAESMILAKMLSLLIVEWDAKDAKPTFEFFQTLPLGLAYELLEFCTGLLNPKKTTAQT